MRKSKDENILCASTTKKEYRIKIVVAGDGGVGKTSLLNRYVSETFLTAMKMTIGTDFFSKVMERQNSVVKLQLWDFGGEKRFRFLLPGYCKGARGVLLAFDLNDFTTLMSLDEWIQIIKENTIDPKIILVGTKVDIAGGVMEEEFIRDFCEKHNIHEFIPTSSKSGRNVDFVFQELVDRILAPLIPEIPLVPITPPEILEPTTPLKPPEPTHPPEIPELITPRVIPGPTHPPEIPEPTPPPEIPKPIIPPEIPEPITPRVIPEPTPPPEIPEPTPPPEIPKPIIPPEISESAPIPFLSDIEFTLEPGENKDWRIKLYVLSRGGFGRRALDFLKNQSIEFEYVFVDELDETVANELREKLKEKYGRHVSYPFLIIDDKKCLVGFDETEYAAVFGIY